MYVDLILWDDENEPHITGPGEVTVEDVEEVIRDHPGSHEDPDDYSASTGLPLIYGDTSAGKHIVVILRGSERRRPHHHPAQDSLPGQRIWRLT